MSRSQQGIGGFAAIAALLLLLPAGSRALSILTFSAAPGWGSSSSLEYPVAGGALSGSGIQIDSLTSITSPNHGGDTIACSGCTLSFTSGNLVSYTPGTPFDAWVFAGGVGSSVQIVGTLPGVGITSTATLLDAVFSEDLTVTSHNSTSYAVNIAIHEGTVAPGISSYFGEGTEISESGGMILSFLLPSVGTGGTFTSASGLEGSLTAEIPEPKTSALLALGLVGLAWTGRSFRRERSYT